MKVLVTGASGFIGGACLRVFAAFSPVGFFSTDYVVDGSAEPYVETDPVHPTMRRDFECARCPI